MAREPADERFEKPRGSTGLKWLGWGAVAAVVAAGGYFAWKHLEPSPARTDTAANSAYSDPMSATPTPYQSASGYDSAENAAPSEESSASAEAAGDNAATPSAPSESAAPAAAPKTAAAAAPTRTASAASAHRSVAAPAAAAAPVAAPATEEVVSILPADASADVEESEPIVVPGSRAPIWVRRPSAQRLSAVYPERALEGGREGEASIHCTVQDSGGLDCVRVSETPANAGFGVAALRVAHMYRHAPQRWDGTQAAGSAVNLRVMFRIADNDRGD